MTMIARITYCRRPLWLRLSRPFMVWMLTDWIADEEAYLMRLRAGGVFSDAQVAQREANLGPVRASLAWWQGA